MCRSKRSDWIQNEPLDTQSQSVGNLQTLKTKYLSAADFDSLLVPLLLELEGHQTS